jgi:hypothetical protein
MSIQYFNGCALSSSSLTTWSEVKVLGPVQKDRLARMEASRGGAMRSQVGTVLVEEIQTRTAVVLKLYWEKRTPRWRGNEDA